MSKANLLKSAKSFCEQEKLRFTAPREKVLNVLLEAEKPIGAYDILTRLSYKDYKPNPPTIYRAIDFWQKYGFVHKITSLNSYVACTHKHTQKAISFIICDSCKTSHEIHLDHIENFRALGKKWDNFRLDVIVTEIHGCCHHCLKQPSHKSRGYT